MDCVLRTRLLWPGNFIRFGIESYSGSDMEQTNKTYPQNDNLANSIESFIEIPATTISIDDPKISDSFNKDSDESETDLPPVYEIPEHMKRNRRQRTGKRSLSCTKSPKEQRFKPSVTSVRVCSYTSRRDSDDSYIELPATTAGSNYGSNQQVQGAGADVEVGSAAVLCKEDLL